MTRDYPTATELFRAERCPLNTPADLSAWATRHATDEILARAIHAIADGRRSANAIVWNR